MISYCCDVFGGKEIPVVEREIMVCLHCIRTFGALESVWEYGRWTRPDVGRTFRAVKNTEYMGEIGGKQWKM